MTNSKSWGRLEYAIYKAWHNTHLYIPGETQAELIVRICRERGALLLTDEEIPTAHQVVEEAIEHYQDNIRNNIPGYTFEATLAAALREAGLAKPDPPRCFWKHLIHDKSKS